MTAPSEYEQKRLENIKKNQSLLSSLAIKAVGPSKKTQKSSAPNSSKSTPSKKRSRPSTSESFIPPKRHVTRASVRLSGIGLTNPDAITSSWDVVDQKYEEEKKKKDELKHADRKLVVENWRAGDQEADLSSLAKTLFKPSSTDHRNDRPLKTMKQEEVNLNYSHGTDKDYDQLSIELEKLKLKSLSKICPNRIYSMNFHPDPQKSLLFVGEKLGGVGIWDALGSDPAVKAEDVEDEDPKSASPTNTAEVSNPSKIPGSNSSSPAKAASGEAESEEEEEPQLLEGTSYFIQAHARYSAVSAIQVHPTQPHLIYTSSYDCTIRELNFETQQSVEIIDGNSLNSDEETLFSAFEFANQGQEIWCSDNAGGLSHRDLREPKGSAKRWQVSKKKIGCVSLCSNLNDRLAVTAGLNREMRLWDLRALTGLSTSSELSEVESASCLTTYMHNLACSSAYFDYSGTKILSTSYDDLVRIWDFNDSPKDSWLSGQSAEQPERSFKPAYQARHDNQTGRWVSVMKARWCPNPLFPSHFTIGNMAQKLDVYNAKGELLTQLRNHALTTVPAVTAQHPQSARLQIAGATAGGKVYLWF